MKAKLRHAVLLQLVSGSFSALGGGGQACGLIYCLNCRKECILALVW